MQGQSPFYVLSAAAIKLSLVNNIWLEMDIPKKISQISKDINHVKQMEVNKFIQELRTAELKAQKNAKNKRLNQVKLQKKKLK